MTSDHEHSYFWNFDSVISVDVKSYVNYPFDPTCVPVIIINFTSFQSFRMRQIIKLLLICNCSKLTVCWDCN